MGWPLRFVGSFSARRVVAVCVTAAVMGVIFRLRGHSLIDSTAYPIGVAIGVLTAGWGIECIGKKSDRDEATSSCKPIDNRSQEK